MARIPANDITFYCYDNEWLVSDLQLYGNLTVISLADNFLEFNLTLDCNYVTANVFNGTFEDSRLKLESDFSVKYSTSNWVKWSKIGDFDFTQDRSNIAGEMPLDWPGDIWHIGKLHKDIIVYGSGGITVLTPVDNVFSKNTVLALGIKSKGAVLTTLHFHIFITSDGTLWRFGETLEQLGYDEFLSVVSNPIISYDSINDLIYICNGTLGYVYNYANRSLGKCSPNISGIVYYKGTSYILGSGTIVNPTTSIKLNSTDLNTTYFKYITSIEVGGTYTGASLTLLYRNISSGNFSSTASKSILPDMKLCPNIGIKEFNCSITGVLDSISYIKISGFISDFELIGLNSYRIESLNDSLIIYSSTHIEILTINSSGVHTKVPLLNIGLKSKGAFCTNGNTHYFITSDSKLWELSSNGLKSLDYSIFINTVASPVMTYDPEARSIYICSDSVGYVYNIDSKSLGKCPAKITGVDIRYPITLLATGALTKLSNYVTLNSNDFNNRSFKSIHEIEIGGEFKSGTQLGISYRNDCTGDFISPIWFSVTHEGRVFPNFFGKEFKIHISTADIIRIDYLRIKGMFTDFNPIDV